MSKLLQRLSDPAKTGVYRASRAEDIVDAIQGSNLRVTRVGLSGVTGKEELLDRVSKALQFPDYFGRNWDALTDCLADLSWIESRGHVLLFEDAQALAASERSALTEVLAATAETWKARKRPFFAVFVDDAAPLPELYQQRR